MNVTREPTEADIPWTLAPRTWREPVNQALISYDELLDYVREIEADRTAYRELAQAAIHALHRNTAEREQLRRRLRQLLDELRVVRQRAAA